MLICVGGAGEDEVLWVGRAGDRGGVIMIEMNH